MILKILVGLAMVPAVYLAIACGLILSQWASTRPLNRESLNFTGVLGAETPPPTEPVAMRDGYPLPVRFYGEAGRGDLVVLVHGSGWHGMQFHRLAQRLAEQAYVAVPDLRGHGAAPARRGDVDHIGQLEEDLGDLVDQLKQDGQVVTLVGHSSGGGLVVRMAGGAYGDRMDKAVLLAPFLQHDAPTMRVNSGGWAQPLVRRLVGLSLLNGVGVRGLNHLTVVQFAMPQAVLEGPLGPTATLAYSYRLNTSYAPRRAYLEDVGALPPFLMIAGREDEAFRAEAFEPTLSAASGQGTYHLIDGAGHLDVVNTPETARLILGHIAR